jgi:hypothetical protein
MFLIGRGVVLKETRQKLSDNLDVKELGEVSKFLSINIRKGARGEVILEPEEYCNVYDEALPGNDPTSGA